MTTAIIPVNSLRLDPSLVPLVYAAAGIRATRREWYDVENHYNDSEHTADVCGCIVTALAAESCQSDDPEGRVEIACRIAQDGTNAISVNLDAPYATIVDAMRERAGISLGTPYMLGLLAGWDADDGDPAAAAMKAESNAIGTYSHSDAKAFMNGWQDGRESLTRHYQGLSASPLYPLVDALEADIPEPFDEDDEDMDEDMDEDDDDDNDDMDEDEDDDDEDFDYDEDDMHDDNDEDEDMDDDDEE